jgi:hypothetical protein
VGSVSGLPVDRVTGAECIGVGCAVTGAGAGRTEGCGRTTGAGRTGRTGGPEYFCASDSTSLTYQSAWLYA